MFLLPNRLRSSIFSPRRPTRHNSTDSVPTSIRWLPSPEVCRMQGNPENTPREIGSEGLVPGAFNTLRSVLACFNITNGPYSVGT